MQFLGLYSDLTNGQTQLLCMWMWNSVLMAVIQFSSSNSGDCIATFTSLCSDISLNQTAHGVVAQDEKLVFVFILTLPRWPSG